MRENQDALPDNARYTSIMSGQTHSRFGSEVTIDDVARAAEVSIRTVSRVLNNSTKVNRDTRARVEEAVARLGFRPSLRARGLATGRSFLMGLLHDEHNALHLADVLRGAAREASRRGYELIVHPMDENDPLGDAIDFVQRSRVDGLLVMAPVSGLEGLAVGLREAGILACALSAITLDGSRRFPGGAPPGRAWAYPHRHRRRAARSHFRPRATRRLHRGLA